jgi:hypothetical protein
MCLSDKGPKPASKRIRNRHLYVFKEQCPSLFPKADVGLLYKMQEIEKKRRKR